ncbi:hypothetical protein GCM10010528_14010 [Gordonia defluvii]|uniref:Transposase n=1 Tax=Gordonia defluvii TaxID=283718 RepID=A0ABP6L6U3_9ACTN
MLSWIVVAQSDTTVTWEVADEAGREDNPATICKEAEFLWLAMNFRRPLSCSSWVLPEKMR